MQKIAVIGRGTAGAISAAAAYHKSISSDTKVAVDWYFDDDIPTQAVGEGTTLVVPSVLSNWLNFQHHNLNEIDGTFKYGISKENWGNGSNFIHPFKLPDVGYHLNAVKLQNYILNLLSNQSNVNIVHKNVTNKEIDADLIIDCSGRPKEYDDFIMSKYIPINSVYVTQCYWDYPRFNYSMTDAMKHGWVFGIPLQNRCSIGYLYNNKFSSLEEVKEDVKSVFQKCNLTPSDTTNAFSFKNYYRKQNYVDNVAYNGNSSFFLDPLEATSTSMMVFIAEMAIKLLEKKFNPISLQNVNNRYNYISESTTNMIMLHYFAGSIFKNDFWDYAESRGTECIKEYYKSHSLFRDVIKYCFLTKNDIRTQNPLFSLDNLEISGVEDNKKFLLAKRQIKSKNLLADYGMWHYTSWDYNINGLSIHDKIKKCLNLNELGDEIVQT